MKTIQFQSTLGAGGQIAIPPDIALVVPAGQPLSIVVRWDGVGDDEDNAWGVQGRVRFEAAYAPEDSVYEELINAPPVR